MIIPLPLIVSLLLAVVQATEFDYNIDFDRCNQDMNCYIRKSCLKESSQIIDPVKKDATKKVLVNFDGPKDKLEGEDCDAVIQIKVLHEKKYLIVMKVKSLDGNEFVSDDHDKGVSILQTNKITNENEVQVACKKGGDKPTVASHFKPEFKGTNPHDFGNTEMRCSILVTPSTEKEIHDSYKDDPLKSQKPSLVYSSAGTDVTLTYDNNAKNFWGPKKMKCSQEHLSSDDMDTKDYQMKAADVSKPTIKCSEGQLTVKYDDGQEAEVNELICGSSSWEMNPEVNFDNEKPLIVGCNKKTYCTSCSDLPPPACEGDDCKKPERDLEEKCMVLTCPDNKYTMDGENNVEPLKKVRCMKKEAGVGAWHIHLKDEDKPELVKKLSCRSTVRCKVKGLSLKCPDNNKNIVNCEAAAVNANETAFNKCPGVRKFYEGDKEKVSYPTCNRKTGEWQGIDPKELLYCAEPKPPVQAPQTSSIGPIVGGAVGAVLLLLAVGGGAFFWFVIRPKRLAAKKIAPPSKGLSSKKSGDGKSAEGASKSKKDKKASASDPAPDSSKKPSASGKDGSPDPATPADAGKPPPSTDIEKLADKNSDPKNPPTPAAGNEPPAPV